MANPKARQYFPATNGTRSGDVFVTPDGLSIGTDEPDGPLHTHTATAGAVTASTVADDFVVENDTAGGMTILVPNASNANFYMGGPTKNNGGIFRWNGASQIFSIGSNLSSGILQLKAGLFATIATVKANGLAMTDGFVQAATQTTTLGSGVTTVAVTKGFLKLTGHAAGNTLATITGVPSGAKLRILFIDALVTITGDDSHTANTVSLSSAFVSHAHGVIELISDGTSLHETSRSFPVTEHAGISVIHNTTETTITTMGVPVQVTVFDNNETSFGMTPDHTNDHITIDRTAHYQILLTATINSISGAGSRYEGTIKKNNGATDIGPCVVDGNIDGGGGHAASITMSAFAELTENDTIEFWIENETNTQNYILENISLTILTLHAE